MKAAEPQSSQSSSGTLDSVVNLAQPANPFEKQLEGRRVGRTKRLD